MYENQQYQFTLFKDNKRIQNFYQKNLDSIMNSELDFLNKDHHLLHWYFIIIKFFFLLIKGMDFLYF